MKNIFQKNHHPPRETNPEDLRDDDGTWGWTHLVGIVRRLYLSDACRVGPPRADADHLRRRPPNAAVRAYGLPRPRRCPGRKPEPVHLREGEEATPVHEEVVLPESRLDGHGRGRVGHDLQDVVPPHRPREVDDGRPARGVVHLLTVGEYQALTGRDRPNERYVVLLPPAGGARLPRGDGVGIREAEPPPHASLRVGDALPARHGREVDGVEGAVRPAARSAAGGGVAGTSGGGRGGGHRGWRLNCKCVR